MTEATTATAGPSADARKWAMINHIVALVGLAGNGIGFLLGPLIVWLLKKDEDPYVDDQGKEAVNFQITMFLGMLISIPLAFVLIGFFTMFIIGILMILFPIIAAVKANNGEYYRYPISIRFIK